MTNRKRPNFDEAKGVMVWQNADQSMKWDGAFNTGDIVSVKYKGKNVHIIVFEKISETDAIGKIKDFEEGMTEHTDLTLDMEIIFEKRHVWGIIKK